MAGHERRFGSKLGQGADGIRGVAFAARFKIFSEHDKRYNDRRTLKKQVFRIARIAEGDLDDRINAVGKRGKRSDRDERVHVRMPLDKAAEAVYIEVPSSDYDRQSEHELYERKGQRRMMRHHEHRKRQTDHVSHGDIQQRHGKAYAQDNAPFHRTELRLLLGILFPAVFRGERVSRDIFLRAEAQARDKLAYLRDIERIVVDDIHFLGREVHRNALHSALPLHEALKACRACGAVHSAYLKRFFCHIITLELAYAN